MTPRSSISLLSWIALACPCVAATGEEFFEQKIRPILVEQCLDCHNAEKRKGGLALDTRGGWQKGGESGPAIVPGQPGASLLIQSIRHADPDLKMPSKAPKLDEAVIADFVRWVELGAPDPREQPAQNTGQRPWAEVLAERSKWWCFQPVVDPPVPAVRDAGWSQHPVDRFVLAKLEASGLRPAPDAAPEIVARRLAFVLTGLPPAPGPADASAEAIDRLLASPAFGEKWARHWLDLARYAETFGSEHDYLNPHAWRYRDYVIRAYNDDLPYDQFIREQIAGDLLQPRWKNGTNEALLGTAWHRMIEYFATPVDVKREEGGIIDWQLEALGKTFLGLTITCARCHDHKFDPISDEDFYALYGVFSSTRPVLNILVDPATLTARDEELLRIKTALRPVLAAQWLRDVRPSALEAALRSNDEKDPLAPLREVAKAPDIGKAWRALRDRHTPAQPAAGSVFADFRGEDLQGWRVAGPGLPSRPSPAGSLSLANGGRFVRAVQPAGYFSDAVSERHGGSLRSPDFILEKRSVSVLASGSNKARLRLVIENHQDDLLLFKQVNPDLVSPAPRWVRMPLKDQWIGRRARVEVLTRDDKTCVGAQKDQQAWAKTSGRSAFGIQRVLLHDGKAPPDSWPFAAIRSIEPKSAEELAGQLSRAARSAVESWLAGRAGDDDTHLLQALLDAGILSGSADASPEIAALAKQFHTIESAIPIATRAPGVCDDGTGRDSEFFPRGDHLRPGAPVPRRFLEILGGRALGGKSSGRLELAAELTRPDNPLVARVMVNRVWQHLFGRGLVATPDNFGRMGEPPSHPELLDHLASKFVADGWSVKKLIRYLLDTRTWRLSAEPPAGADEIDPGNTLLSHANVRRLEAEAIRDAMLAVAGNLANDHQGPGRRVAYRTQIDPDKQPPSGSLDAGGCRSIYLEARRLFPSAFLAAFDAPRPNVYMGRRSETNVPAQSLALMNDPFVQHQAKLVAERLVGEGNSDAGKVTRLYQLAFGRAPTAAESARSLAFLREAGDDRWSDLAHAVFNMKEFIYLR